MTPLEGSLEPGTVAGVYGRSSLTPLTGWSALPARARRREGSATRPFRPEVAILIRAEKASAEPASLAVVGAGLLGAGLARRRRS